jgi:hypothetical protein
VLAFWINTTKPAILTPAKTAVTQIYSIIDWAFLNLLFFIFFSSK